MFPDYVSEDRELTSCSIGGFISTDDHVFFSKWSICFPTYFSPELHFTQTVVRQLERNNRLAKLVENFMINKKLSWLFVLFNQYYLMGEMRSIQGKVSGKVLIKSLISLTWRTPYSRTTCKDERKTKVNRASLLNASSARNNEKRRKG